MKIGGETEGLAQTLARKVALQAEQEVNLIAMQAELLELHGAVRRLEARVGIEKTAEPTFGEELSRQIGTHDPVLERYRAEYLRIHDEMDELWRKRRELDAVNPIGGLTEQRWREFDAERAALRRRLATAGLQPDDEAAPA